MGGVVLRAGAVIGCRFELDGLLGEGGMGEVWSARELATGEPRALKFLKTASSQSEERRRRFLREGRAAMTLRNPHVVAIHSVEDGDQPFLVMDLLRGETLRAHLDRRVRLPLSAALSIFMPVIAAVGAAHAHGIVHRDLKPENIFLTPGDGDAMEVRVLDFGVAKFAASLSTPQLTESGDRLGTPRYMAPEQARGSRDVDHRADLWSIGVMLWEALGGRHPIAGDSVGAIYRAITMDPVPPLATEAPELPEEVSALVMRMLEREQQSRPRDLCEVAAVLARHYDGDVARIEPPTVDEEERASRRSFSTIDETVDGTTVPMRRRSGRRVALLLVVLSALAILVTYAAVRRGASSAARSSAAP